MNTPKLDEIIESLELQGGVTFHDFTEALKEIRDLIKKLGAE